MAEATQTVDETTQAEPTSGPLSAVKINGNEYPLGKLTMADVGDLRVWIQKRRPDPLEAIRGQIDGFEPALQRAMLDNALLEIRRPVVYGDAEFVTALQSKEGLREALWMLLKRGGASVSRDASDAAADSLALVEAFSVIAKVF